MQPSLPKVHLTNVKILWFIVFSFEIILVALFYVSKTGFFLSLIFLAGLFAITYLTFFQILLVVTFLLIALPGYIPFSVPMPNPEIYNFKRIMIIAAAVSMLWWVRSALIGKFALIKDRLTTPVAIFLGLCALATALGLIRGNDFMPIIKDFGIFFLYAFYFIFRALFKQKEQVKYLIYVILLASTFAALVYIYTFLTVPFGSNEMGRIVTRQVHFFMVSFPFLLSFLIWDRSKSIRPFVIAALCIILIATLISQTRGTWVSMLAGASVVFFLAYRERKILGKTVLIIGILIVVGVTSIGYGTQFNLYEKIVARAASFSNLREDPSAIFRTVLYFGALNKFFERPILGQGFGDFVDVKVNGFHFVVQWVDSTWLSLLWKMGIVGFLAYAVLFLIVFWRTFCLHRWAQDPFSKIVGVSMLGLMFSFSAISLISPVMLKYRFSFVWVFMFAAIDFLATRAQRERFLCK